LCKWIIQMERKIFLFNFFITFNYVVVTIRERGNFCFRKNQIKLVLLVEVLLLFLSSTV
jgi:hypothetical protein